MENFFVRQYLKNRTAKTVIRNGKLAGKNHPKSGVSFNANGFPKFTPKFQVSLSQKYWKSTNTTQFSQANAQLRIAVNTNLKHKSKFNTFQLNDIANGKTPNGYVWHHHELTGILQLVEKGVHAKTGHTGGKAIWGSL